MEANRQKYQEQHNILAQKQAEKMKKQEEEKRKEKIEKWEKFNKGTFNEVRKLNEGTQVMSRCSKNIDSNKQPGMQEAMEASRRRYQEQHNRLAQKQITKSQKNKEVEQKEKVEREDNFGQSPSSNIQRLHAYDGLEVYPNPSQGQQMARPRHSQPGEAQQMTGPRLPQPSQAQQMTGPRLPQPGQAQQMIRPMLPQPGEAEQMTRRRLPQPGEARQRIRLSRQQMAKLYGRGFSSRK